MPVFVRPRGLGGRRRRTIDAAGSGRTLVRGAGAGLSCATGAVFNDSELTRNSSLITITDFMMGAGGNDCEAVVYRRYPEVAAAASWLARYGPARLTGTGACVFASSECRPSSARAGPAATGWKGFVARGRNRSPLHERLTRAHAAFA